MPRKSTPKNDVPPSQDDQILRMKAELKKMHSKIAEEKKKRRRLRRKLKEAVEKMEEVLSSAAVETLLNKARVEMAKGGYEATRTELREKQVKLKLATDREVQEDIVKKDQETIRRLEQRNMELTEALENGLDRKSWKECELCSQEFKEEGDRVPKLLKCGDTLCLGCVKHLANPDFLICPFDGTVFTFTEFNNIDHLQSNFKAL